jgi:hypothetical protein
MDALSATGRALCHHRHSCDGEPFSAPQHRPGDSRQLVGEGDNGHVVMSATHKLFRPSAERRVALSHIGQSRTRSMDQLPAEVFVAALADPEQLRLAAGRELTGNQAEPRGEIAPALEALSLAGIVGSLEGPDPVRLELMGSPYALDRSQRRSRAARSGDGPGETRSLPKA